MIEYVPKNSNMSEVKVNGRYFLVDVSEYNDKHKKFFCNYCGEKFHRKK